MHLLWLLACSPQPLETCACPADVTGHAVVIEGACSCLPSLAPLPRLTEAARFELSSGETLDWDALDAALADGDVVVEFEPDGRWDDRIEILRTDEGPHRLELDGGSGDARASVAGILTPFEGPPRHRVTLRGFEITGSRDKGIYWWAGDGVWIEDVIVHDNKGSPAINLDYANRSGHPSTGFTLRNSHVYAHGGEGVYIGGSEGEDLDAHTDVVIENNLVHDFHNAFDSKHDGINVKDRLANVRVHRNVVLRTDWGIEVASPGSYTNNLVIETAREGFQISDAFQAIGDMQLVDNAVLRPGHDGFHVSTDTARAEGMHLERSTVLEARQAGVLIASNTGIDMTIEGIVVAGSGAALDGWGEQADLAVDACFAGDNEVDIDRIFEGRDIICEPATLPDTTQPAGPDGLFFTEDDPWLVDGGAALP